MEPLKVIMIGIGGMGKGHFRRLMERDHFDVVAVCEAHLDREDVRESLERARERGIPVFTDYGEAYDKIDAEAAFISTPHFLHRPMTVDALDRGMHVFVEKPPACCVEDCRLMLEAQQRSGKVVAVGFNPTSEPDTLALKDAVARGRLGKVRELVVKMVWHRSEEYMQRAAWVGRRMVAGCVCADGVLNNQATHYITQALFLANEDKAPAMSRGTRVRAELFKAHESEQLEMEDLACAVIELDSDPDKKLFLYATTNSQGNEYTDIQVIGTEARTRGLDTLVFPDREEKLEPEQELPDKQDNFYQAVRQGVAPYCPLDEAVKNVYTIEAVYEAADWRIKKVPWSAMTEGRISALLEQAAERRCLVSELDDAPAWARD